MQTDRIGKKEVYRSDAKRSRPFGAELDQNSLPETKIDNFTKSKSRHAVTSFKQQHGDSSEQARAYTVTFQCPDDSGTIARFAVMSASSRQGEPETTKVELESRKSSEAAVLQQSVGDDTANENRVTVNTPLEEVDFLLSHSQIATQQDENAESLLPSSRQADPVKHREAEDDETEEHPAGTDQSTRTVPRSPTKNSFNCHAPVKPNKGQLPLMCH